MIGTIALLAFSAIAGAAPLAAPSASPVPAAPINETAAIVLEAELADSYTMYRGDGSTGQGWPADWQWYSYEALWGANEPLMRQSCGWNGWGADNSWQEIQDINAAVNQVAGETGVDRRFILAIIMQESKGCVRAPTTNNGVVNPGLMQSHNGSGSCWGVNPCPAWQIVQMVRDGTAGTSNGDGLRQVLAQTSGAVGGGSRAIYAAARKYNSGSVNYADLGVSFGSTACYASDVANRLMGWTLAASQCW
jgi:hypothetical protein